METTIVYWGFIGIMENQMETTIVYWGFIGKMEKKMETTIVYCSFTGSGGGGFRFLADFTKSMKSVLPETSLPGQENRS